MLDCVISHLYVTCEKRDHILASSKQGCRDMRGLHHLHGLIMQCL